MATDFKVFARLLALTAGFSLLAGLVFSSPPVGAAAEPDAGAPGTTDTTPGLVEETLISRGNDLLEAGDFASARVLFQAAANQGSARAAMLTGVTFDPRYRELAGMPGPPSDAKLARQWYALATRRGDAEARRNDLELVHWLENHNIDPDTMAAGPTEPAPVPEARPEREATTGAKPVAPEPESAAEAKPDAEPPPGEASSEPAMKEAPSGGAPSMDVPDFDDRVVRAQLTSAVRDREPVDKLPSSIRVSDGGKDRIVFFSEVHDLAGQTLSHRWEREGETMADISFVIGPGTWRVHSSKRVTPAMTGAWRVVMVDEVGAELASVPFILE